MKPKIASGASPVRVYFLGSGHIGVPTLERLHEDPRIVLVGVGTQPDRPTGRRKKLTPTAIGAAAAALGLSPDKPQSVNDPLFLQQLGAQEPDTVAVLSFGQFLKQPLLDLPRFGCLNIHTSLLPRHRGAAPVAAAILAGDTESGISYIRMDAGLDTGPVYARLPVPVGDRETAAGLEARLGNLAAASIVDTVVAVCRQDLVAVAQDDSAATTATKLKKQDGKIDWREDATTIERKIRAYQPWPRAWFELVTGRGTKRVQITEAAEVSPPDSSRGQNTPGKIIQADKNAWVVACGGGSALELRRIIPEGSREMPAEAFLRGTPVEGSACLAGA